MATQTTTEAQLDTVAAALEDLAATAFDLVDRIATVAHSRLDRPGPVRRADLAGIDGVVLDEIARPGGIVQGAGFIAAVGVLDDARWWLEWFARDPDDRAQRLVAQSDPNGIGFFDYEHLPWYVVPRDTGSRHVTGPYVDYLCTEDYTLTFTAPVTVGTAFRGVAGADVRVHAAEQRLLPVLRASRTRLAVVNAHGRILASNSGRHLCGDLLEEADVRDLWPGSDRSDRVRRAGVRALEDLPFAVVDLDALHGR